MCVRGIVGEEEWVKGRRLFHARVMLRWEVYAKKPDHQRGSQAKSFQHLKDLNPHWWKGLTLARA